MTGRTLAILGGRPAYADPLHVGRPNIGDEDALRRRLDGMLARRWLTNGGPLVEEFEARVADRLGVRHCVATANGTLALQLAAWAIELSGEVIVPSFTFIASASALTWQGLRPVFCDIDAESHALDPRHAETLVTPRTSAILPVHLWGQIRHVEAWEALARRHGLPLLIDGAHAFGSSWRGRMAGSFGTATVLSFHATKILNAFEGGAVVTDDAGLAERLRRLRNFGFVGPDAVVESGINAKMSEASAAMGLTSLESLDEFIAVNRANHARYAEGLADVPGVRLRPGDGDGCISNDHYVVVDVDAGAAGLDRNEILAALNAEGVLARRYFYPGCHRTPPYGRVNAPAAHLPVTERIADRIFQLPTGTAVGPDDVATVSEIIRHAVQMAPQVRTAARAGAAEPQAALGWDGGG